MEFIIQIGHKSKVHVGATDSNVPFCGIKDYWAQVYRTEVWMEQSKKDKARGTPAMVAFNFLPNYRSPPEKLFRNAFCQKCYKAMVKADPTLQTELI